MKFPKSAPLDEAEIFATEAEDDDLAFDPSTDIELPDDLDLFESVATFHVIDDDDV